MSAEPLIQDAVSLAELSWSATMAITRRGLAFQRKVRVAFENNRSGKTNTQLEHAPHSQDACCLAKMEQNMQE